MSFKSHCITLVLSALAFASVAAAQVPSKTTRYYRVPTDLNLWECCTPNEPELSFETLAEQTTRRRPVATYLGDRSWRPLQPASMSHKLSGTGSN